MKKVLIAVGMMFLMAAPAMASDVKISGKMELQYRNSSDKYDTDGDDGFKVEEIYIKIQKEVAEDIVAYIKLDGADMEDDTHDSDMVEEAQIIFKNVANQPLTLYVGKDEMPWIQDYESFLFSSEVHGKEVDKVYGFHGQYKIDGFGSLDFAFYERNTLNSGVSDVETELMDSYTVKLKANKLVENLSLSVGYMQEGEDEAFASGETDDETAWSVAAKYKMDALTLYAEVVEIDEHDGTSEEEIMQVGVNYKVGNLLLKARHEIVDPDKGSGDDDTVTAFGVSYYFNDKAYIVLEHENDDPDTGSEVDEWLVGFVTKF